MKLVFWIVVIFLGYRFWYLPKQLKAGKKAEQELEAEQERNNQDYTDYEEVD